MTTRLPNSRTIVHLLAVAIFVATLLANLVLGKTPFEIKKDNVLDNPNRAAHQALAQEFLRANQLEIAASEFALANDQGSLETIAKLKSAPAETKKQIFFWEKVAEKFPHYRDVYLKLAILNYKIGNPTESKKYLENALVIDPNNEVAKKLSDLLYRP